MGGIMNGMALHGGFRPYGSTFLVFSDYMRPSIRLAALMGLPVIYVFTHDSICVGEDGPTHQPVEHAGQPAGHPRPDRHPPGRRQRDGRRLADRRGAPRWPGGAAADPPEAADPGRGGRRGRGPRRLRPRRRARARR